MAINKFTNNFATTLNGSIDGSTTTIVLTSATGLPAIGASEQFYLTIDDGTNIEVVLVTDDTSSPSFTVTRNADGNGSHAFADLTPVEMRPDAKQMEGMIQQVNTKQGQSITLDPDDLDDTSTTNKFTTAGDISKLAGIESGADVTDEANVKAALDGATTTEVTPESGDKILLLDASDSDNLKHALFSGFGGGGGDMVLLATATASNSTSIDFTGLSSTYYAYKLIYNNIKPVSDTVSMYLRTSTDNGANYDAGASDYSHIRFVALMNTSTSVQASGDEAASEILITTGLGTSTEESIDGELTLYNPSATGHTRVTFTGTVRIFDTTYYYTNGGGVRLSAADVDAIRIILSSGNISSGEFRLYGIKGS